MARSLSPEAIEALRRLNEVGIGQVAPALTPGVAGELLGMGLVVEAAGGEVEITCDGRQYLSSDCD